MRPIPTHVADPAVAALLVHHAEVARAQTARGSAHALDLAAFSASDIQLWAVWDDGALLAVGALRRLAGGVGEIKAMHTAEVARRRGAASAMLRRLIAEARGLGLSRISLETGAWPFFEPARALYRAHGFVNCAPFGDYRPDPNSVFLTLDLADGST
jgi:putative acetyltransferase